MLNVKNILRNIRHVFRLSVGFLRYGLTGKTPPVAYMSMIALFCNTKGYSNDFLSWVIGLCRRPYKFTKGEVGILGAIGDEEARTAVTVLKEQGYYVFKNRLPDEMCERLLAYATTQPAEMRQMDGDKPGGLIKEVYQRGAPRAVRYDFLPQDLLQNKDMQRLLADMSLGALAQDYLGARPVIDIVALWWLTKFSDVPDGEAAQYFHFDMDRPKWLKFFIYLTDVGPENGSHSFVAGSHRSGAIASKLLDKGYSRLSDEEVKEEFDAKDFIELSAPRGTIFAEDTRGLHKGKHVIAGDRLVLQIQFSNSLFGATHARTQMSDDVMPDLKMQIEKYPDIYSYLQGR